jgi:hypothetical protein
MTSDDLMMALVVGVVVFVLTIAGLRSMEAPICESYEGNSYDWATGVCIWPPLFDPSPSPRRR